VNITEEFVSVREIVGTVVLRGCINMGADVCTAVVGASVMSMGRGSIVTGSASVGVEVAIAAAGAAV